MPRITIAPTWEITKIEDIATWSGKLSGDMVYKFTTVDEDGTTYETIGSIANVKPCEDCQEITLSIIYENNTFRLVDPDNEDDKIFTCDLTAVEEMYVARRQAERRPRSVSDDPFVFSFMNPNTGRHFSQYVDREHFVGISKFSAPNQRNKIIYGCIDRMTDDGKSIVVNALIGHSGFYTSEERTIRISDIRGIYAYNAVPVTYAEGMKFAEETRARRAARMAAKSTTAEAPVPETVTEEDVTAAVESDAKGDGQLIPDPESETSGSASIPPYYMNNPAN